MTSHCRLVGEGRNPPRPSQTFSLTSPFETDNKKGRAASNPAFFELTIEYWFT